jgi:hypothetical protein
MARRLPAGRVMGPLSFAARASLVVGRRLKALGFGQPVRGELPVRFGERRKKLLNLSSGSRSSADFQTQIGVFSIYGLHVASRLHSADIVVRT